MKTTHRQVLGICGIALLAGHCGGRAISGGSRPGAADSGDSAAFEAVSEASGDDSYPLGSSGVCEGTARRDGARGLPGEHRAVAVGCSASQQSPPPPRDSGADAGDGSMPCSSDADCESDSGSVSLAPHCLDGHCSADQCLVDAQCPTGHVCVCSADTGSAFSRHGNTCVPANCRIDSDCGPSEYCSPSRGYCSSVTGFFCTTKDDSCMDPATDCECGGNACVYVPAVGHYLCGSSVCMG